MAELIAKVTRYVWTFVEFGFVAVLGIMLIYLVLGENSGVFILSVARNVIKFANDMPPGSLVGFAIVGGLLYWLGQRSGKPASP